MKIRWKKKKITISSGNLYHAQLFLKQDQLSLVSIMMREAAGLLEKQNTQESALCMLGKKIREK